LLGVARRCSPFWEKTAFSADVPAEKSEVRGYSQPREQFYKAIGQELQASTRLYKAIQGYLMFFERSIPKRQAAKSITSNIRHPTPNSE
jgi:hypothetical protein